MSIIQTIRDKGSWVMVVLLVLALVSFIFMDGGRRSNMFGGSNNKTVAKINGSAIKQDEFGKRVDAVLYAFKNNPQATRDAASNMVWQQMIEEKAMASEYEKFDIGFDNKVLTDMAIGKYGNPSQYVTQLFRTFFNDQVVDPQTGQLNPAQAEMALKQMKSLSVNDPEAQKFLDAFNNLLPLAKFEYMSNKYNILMGSTANVPDWLANKKLTEDNLLTNISFVQVPYNEINDSTITELKVTDKDINDFISKYPNRYKNLDSRTIDYTSFDFSPTGLDSANVRNALEAKLEKLRLTNDTTIGSFINNTSSLIPYSGSYVRRKDVNLSDSGAILEKGKTFGPFVKENNYVISKVMDVKNYPDTANVRHILIKTFDPNTGKVLKDEESARKLLDSIIGLYKGGQAFDSLAKRFSEDEGSKNNGGLYENLTIATNFIPEFLDFALTHSAGATDTLKSVYGFHFMKAEGTKGSVKPAYKMAYIAKAITPSQKTKDSVQGVSDAFASKVRTGKEFDEYFVKNGNLLKTPGVKIDRENLRINGLNDDIKDIAKWAFDAKVNTVSNSFALDKAYKFVVAKLAGTQQEGLMTAADIKAADPSTLNTIANEKKYTYLSKKYGTVTSLEDAATKTGKQIMGKDSVSFGSGVIPGLSPEARVVACAFNANAATKVSGPVKGTTGLFYVKANGAPYNKPAENIDLKQYKKQLEQDIMRASQQAKDAYIKKASLKDNRLETGF